MKNKTLLGILGASVIAATAGVAGFVAGRYTASRPEFTQPQSQIIIERPSDLYINLDGQIEARINFQNQELLKNYGRADAESLFRNMMLDIRGDMALPELKDVINEIYIDALERKLEILKKINEKRIKELEGNIRYRNDA